RVLRRRDGVVLRKTGPARARASRTVRAAAGVLPAGSRASNAVRRPMTPSRLIDVSHTIEDGMVTYPGLPVPVISDWLSRDASQTRYGTGLPCPTRAAAAHLMAAGAALVGIDSLNIDDATDGARPAHTLLLGAGIPIVEHLCGLGELPDAGFRFFAVPVKVRGMGSFPVRAFAVLEE